ncbi:uncharacterized [Tachysurus ichikawai]
MLIHEGQIQRAGYYPEQSCSALHRCLKLSSEPMFESQKGHKARNIQPEPSRPYTSVTNSSPPIEVPLGERAQSCDLL